MEDRWIYRYDKENLNYRPVSRLSQMIYDNVLWIVVCMLMIGFIVWLNDSLQMNKAIRDRDAEIAKLTQLLEMEEEADVLHVKIAQATLEGKKNIAFNDSIVFEYIKSCKAWYPEIIMAQYKIESASGTSDVAKKANNFFGMKPVQGKRKHYTTQRHGDSYCGYAVYDNWKLSIIDKILWEHFRFNEVKPDRETYLKAHLNYAEADEYIKTIKKVAKKYE